MLDRPDLKRREISGKGQIGQVAVWDGGSRLAGSEDLVFDDVAGKLTVKGKPLVADVAKDGVLYARRNRKWEAFSPGGGGGGSSSSGSGEGGGEPGPMGPEGPMGPAGPQGEPGPEGEPGADSTVPGPEGPAGADGVDGATGPAGPQGDTGIQGPAGPEGPEGPQGDPGPAGADGADSTVPGPEGPMGPTGPQGIQGPKGDTGDTGPAGTADTAAQVLAKLITVDGVGSGLDADLLDGQDSAYYLALGNATGAISDAQHGNRGGGALHAAATSSVAGFMTDALSDSKQYARRDGAWVEVVAFTSSAVHEYMFNATTSAPPSSGTVRFNNATQTSVTTIWFNYTNYDGVDLKTYFAQRVKVGDVFYFQDRDDSSKWQMYELNAAYTDNGAYATMPVTWRAGGTTIGAARIIVSREGASVSSPIGEAPTDGKPYVRKSANWDDFTDDMALKLDASAYTAADVLTKIKTVDGAASGLDADLLDAQSGAYYLSRTNHTGTQASTTITGLGTASLKNLHVGTTAPGSPAVNDLWLDTT